MDDYACHETDEFERFKKYKALKKHVIGDTPAIMREDNDEKWEYNDIQGENLYSHPPDPNHIVVDHGLDEEHIWAFQKTLYNQEVITNPYTQPYANALHLSFAPRWGHKLCQPHYYKQAKMDKFVRHW